MNHYKIYCDSCGRHNHEENNFCPNCGNPLNKLYEEVNKFNDGERSEPTRSVTSIHGINTPTARFYTYYTPTYLEYLRSVVNGK